MKGGAFISSRPSLHAKHRRRRCLSSPARDSPSLQRNYAAAVCLRKEGCGKRAWCGRGESNPHGTSPSDFKSLASTIPPRPQSKQSSIIRQLLSSSQSYKISTFSLILRRTPSRSSNADSSKEVSLERKTTRTPADFPSLNEG